MQSSAHSLHLPPQIYDLALREERNKHRKRMKHFYTFIKAHSCPCSQAFSGIGAGEAGKYIPYVKDHNQHALITIKHFLNVFGENNVFR